MTGLIRVEPGLIAFLSKGGWDMDVFSREIVVLECIVAGTSFRDLETVEDLLISADTLVMKREPKNEHDAFAIALYIDEHKVGYIPKNKNEVIARMMDAGKQFITKISCLNWEGNWLKVEVKVVYKD